jgi:uncharacterized protein (DUF302 family)
VRRYLSALLVMMFCSGSVLAEHLLMVRAATGFPETMLNLQNSIKEHGYTVSRVQRVDIGLTASGYQTDKYRIVFFGKPQEIRRLTAKYPQLIPYLPLKLTIFAERDETIVVTEDMTLLQALAPDNEVGILFVRWKNDLLSIMQELREAGEM